MNCLQNPVGRAFLMMIVLFPYLALFTPLAAGQNEIRSINGEGNRLYSEQQWAEALERYTAAGQLNPDDPVLHYNLANALYRLNDLEQAETHYRMAAASDDRELARRARFNLGNTGFRKAESLEGAGDWQGRNQALVQAIGHWQSVLQGDPDNHDAKLNLELARKKLQEKPPENQQQQQQEDPQEQDEQEQDEQEQQQSGQQDQEQDQQEEKQQQQDEQEGEEQEKEQQSDSAEDEQQQEQQEQQSAEQQQQEQEQQAGEEQAEQMRISPEEAQRILDALRDEEMEEQKRQMAERKGRGGSAERDW